MTGKEQLTKVRERVIESIAQNIHLFGVTPSIGRLYGMMLFHHDPLTLDEMKEELGMSKTSMSTSVRTLSDLKMVERVWKKGIRKDLYKVKEDWYQNFIDLFSTKWRTSISMNIHAIKKAINDLKKLQAAEEMSDDVKQFVEEDLVKLQDMLNYYGWLNRLIDTFESHEIFTFIPKNDEEQKNDLYNFIKKQNRP
ncbi:GbsR/MarR family transcriptional regulator [Bacillus aerolatus]|uniref:HTH-type transcriptional regulator n=1 Tax=Bacillus aerolatus TaxID=2653354 RepID=A0A6I1FJD9_9BACI|nr:GbsR/MarR family transcriptional regulator [Bacillus aerolatus]KAB7705956.1 GbsR/MarR family transcriptional regulator [Bacillus aerolatus]